MLCVPPSTQQCKEAARFREVYITRQVFRILQSHYKNTPIQIHCKFYRRKYENIKMKNCDIFLTFAQNIDCEYSLEPPQRGGSNEYHNLCFQPEIRIIMYMYTPVNPSFII